MSQMINIDFELSNLNYLTMSKVEIDKVISGTLRERKEISFTNGLPNL